jgi:uncharacterized damage-inducible protein DinB
MCGQDREVLEDPLALLRETPRQLPYAIRGLKPDQLTWQPREGEWSIQQVLFHLADVQILLGFRYRKMLAEDNPELVGFSPDLWASRLAYHQRQPRSALNQFRALRRADLELLGAIPPEAWERTGRHPVHGPISLRQMVEHAFHHDQAHLAQIKAVKAALPPSTP